MIKEFIQPINLEEENSNMRIYNKEYFKNYYRKNRFLILEKSRERYRIKQNIFYFFKYLDELDKNEKKLVFTKEFCYLMGVGLGDGCFIIKEFEQKSKYKNKMYCYPAYRYAFQLTTVDKDFALKFKECLDKIFLLNVKIYEQKRETQINNKKYTRIYYRVQLNRKDFVILLKRYFDNLNWIFELPLELKKEIIRGIFDSEGCVNIYTTNGKKNIRFLIGIVDKERFKLETVKKLIENVGLHYNLHISQQSKSSFTKRPTFTIGFHKNAKEFYDFLGNLTIQRKENIAKNYFGGIVA
jgi:hypothetical protein